MSEPLVSVVTVCKNRGPFMRRCIDSVLAQDYGNIEHIVQDGASTDETVAILRSYGNRLDWRSEPDSGIGEGYNRALQRCHGDIITCLESDNTLHPHAVSSAVESFRAHPGVALVYGDMEIVDGEGNTIAIHRGPSPYEYVQILCIEKMIGLPSVFIRRTCWEQVGFHVDDSISTCQDFELWTRLGLRYPFHYSPVVMSRFTRHPGSLSSQHAAASRFAADAMTVVSRLLNSPETPASIRLLRSRAMAGVYNYYAGLYAEFDYVAQLRWLARSLITQPSPPRILRLAIAVAVPRPMVAALDRFGKEHEESSRLVRIAFVALRALHRRIYSLAS